LKVPPGALVPKVHPCYATGPVQRFSFRTNFPRRLFFSKCSKFYFLKIFSAKHYSFVFLPPALVINSFSQPPFPLGRVVGSAALGGLEIPHGFQKLATVPLTPHKDGTKQGRRCTDATWSMDDIWAAFSWVVFHLA